MKVSRSAFAGIAARAFLLSATAVPLSACQSLNGWIASAGPGKTRVQNAPATSTLAAGIHVADLSETVVQRLDAGRARLTFSGAFGSSAKPAYIIGPGDVIDITIWEAPPATLFSTAAIDPSTGIATTRSIGLPHQMVNAEGAVSIPFAGQIPVAGLTPQEIAAKIEKALKGKANQPQVLVRVIQNVTETVTVVGEVASSIRMPLTAHGERALDALAAAGGVRQPVDKMTMRITRGNRVEAMPLQAVIEDPAQNIMLQPGDVLTMVHQPLSFTVLGATVKNEEINFETKGISLTQALARAGGLNDNRADARGVFIFRYESPDALDGGAKSLATTPDGKVPVIYRVDLKNPSNFFLAQKLQIKDKDVLYVSNAPAADFQKFLNIVVSVAYPVLNVINTAR